MRIFAKIAKNLKFGFVNLIKATLPALPKPKAKKNPMK